MALGKVITQTEGRDFLYGLLDTRLLDYLMLYRKKIIEESFGKSYDFDPF